MSYEKRTGRASGTLRQLELKLITIYGLICA